MSICILCVNLIKRKAPQKCPLCVTLKVCVVHTAGTESVRPHRIVLTDPDPTHAPNTTNPHAAVVRHHPTPTPTHPHAHTSSLPPSRFPRQPNQRLRLPSLAADELSPLLPPSPPRRRGSPRAGPDRSIARRAPPTPTPRDGSQGGVSCSCGGGGGGGGGVSRGGTGARARWMPPRAPPSSSTTAQGKAVVGWFVCLFVCPLARCALLRLLASLRDPCAACA